MGLLGRPGEERTFRHDLSPERIRAVVESALRENGWVAHDLGGKLVAKIRRTLSTPAANLTVDLTRPGRLMARSELESRLALVDGFGTTRAVLARFFSALRLDEVGDRSGPACPARAPEATPPAGERPVDPMLGGAVHLPRVDRSPRHALPRLAALLEHLLPVVEEQDGASDPSRPTLGELVDRNRQLFSSVPDVFWSLGIRNQLLHVRGATTLTPEEVLRAAGHLVLAVEDVLSLVPESLAREIVRDPDRSAFGEPPFPGKLGEKVLELDRTLCRLDRLEGGTAPIPVSRDPWVALRHRCARHRLRFWRITPPDLQGALDRAREGVRLDSAEKGRVRATIEAALGDLRDDLDEERFVDPQRSLLGRPSLLQILADPDAAGQVTGLARHLELGLLRLEGSEGRDPEARAEEGTPPPTIMELLERHGGAAGEIAPVRRALGIRNALVHGRSATRGIPMAEIEEARDVLSRAAWSIYGRKVNLAALRTGAFFATVPVASAMGFRSPKRRLVALLSRMVSLLAVVDADVRLQPAFPDPGSDAWWSRVLTEWDPTADETAILRARDVANRLRRPWPEDPEVPERELDRSIRVLADTTRRLEAALKADRRRPLRRGDGAPRWSYLSRLVRALSGSGPPGRGRGTGLMCLPDPEARIHPRRNRKGRVPARVIRASALTTLPVGVLRRRWLSVRLRTGPFLWVSGILALLAPVWQQTAVHLAALTVVVGIGAARIATLHVICQHLLPGSLSDQLASAFRPRAFGFTFSLFFGGGLLLLDALGFCLPAEFPQFMVAFTRAALAVFLWMVSTMAMLPRASRPPEFLTR